MRRLLATLLLPLALGSTARAGDQVGQVTNMKGVVLVKHDTDSEFIQVEGGADTAPVYNLDAWRTEKESTCEIFLDNGSIFVLQPETLIVVRIDEPRRLLSLELRQGSVKAITINSPDYETNILTPSAFVTQRGGIFINRVQSEGHLKVENQQGELSIVHNYGTTLVLGAGQTAELVTDFTVDRRVFTVHAPAENSGGILARILDRVNVSLPAGTTTSIENALVPGEGGEIIIQASLDNQEIVLIEVGDETSPILSHETQPGERVVIRFTKDLETDIDVEVGDLTPRDIPFPEPDDPFENPSDILPPPPAPPGFVIIPDTPASPIE